MTRAIAGVFGAGAAKTGAAETAAVARRRLGDAERLDDSSLALAWTGAGAHRGDLTLLVSGRLHNLPSLGRELGVEERAAEGIAPEHVLALAFGRWREGMLPRLRGSFVIVVWERATQAGFVAVDQLGVGSLFFHEAAGRLSFATEVTDLARLLPVRPAPEPRGLVQWLVDGYLERGETLLRGIRRLEGGQLVRLERDRWRADRYWSPRYVAPAPTSPAEAADLVGAAIVDAVSGRMAADGVTGVLLSGGLDSSTVAAVASRLERPRGPVHAYSLVHPEHPELDESAHVEQVVRALGLRSDALTISGPATMPTALEYQRAWDLPSPTPMLAFTLPLLQRAASDGVRVVLDGEGGDELFGCSPPLVADRLRRLDVRGAIDLAQLLPGTDDLSQRELWALLRDIGLKGIAPYELHRVLGRLPRRRGYARQLLTPASADLYSSARDRWTWKRLDGPRWWAYLADLVTTTGETVGHDFFRHRAALAGVDNGHPLLDDLDLVELVLRLPPELAFDRALTRPVLRQAVTGALPEDIRLRRDKVDFSPLLVEALGGPDHRIVVELLGAGDAELFAYVASAKVRDLLATPVQRRHGVWGRLVWRLATTEAWLRSQQDPDFPQRLLESHGVVSAA